MKKYAYEQATGTIDYTFTNDYMFRAVLERNKKVLKALICALLHLDPNRVRSVKITNPITLGESREDKAAIHIGFLDFTPFPNVPEFYAVHKLMNLKNHHVYSDKFILSMIDLTKIDMATAEDKAYNIDYWARLFKANTWEELKMIAEKDENLREASESLYTLNADDITRQKCRAREDQIRLQKKMEHKIEVLTQENESLKKLLQLHNISYE